MTADTFLRDLGLNEKEINIYAFLAKNGPQKALSIARNLRMHKMQVYRYLDAMQKKGVISQTFEAPKRFVALPIKKLVKSRIQGLREKLFSIEKSSEKILNYSGFSFHTQEQLSTFSIVQGKEKVEGLISELLNRATKEICIVTSGEKLGKLILAAADDHSAETKTEFSSRYIIQAATKDTAKSTAQFLKTLIATGGRLHMFTANNKLPELVVVDDREAILVVEESAMTILWTDNASMTCAFKGFFEKLWIDSVEMLPDLKAM